MRKDTAIRAAEEAGEIQCQNRPEDVDKKTPLDPVTDIDMECEYRVREIVEESHPEDEFLGEETGGEIGSEGYNWVVDPIDGTANYLHGVPHYTSSVAVIKDDHPVIGVVHHTPTEDTYTAVKGEGAYLDGEKISVTDNDISNSVVATGFHPDVSESHYSAVKDIVEKTQGVRRLGSASFDLCMVAEGTVDCFYETHLNPWDIAAGVLIVKEAGGKVTDLQDRERWEKVSKGRIVASNGVVHDEVIESI